MPSQAPPTPPSSSPPATPPRRTSGVVSWPQTPPTETDELESLLGQKHPKVSEHHRHNKEYSRISRSPQVQKRGTSNDALRSANSTAWSNRARWTIVDPDALDFNQQFGPPPHLPTQPSRKEDSESRTSRVKPGSLSQSSDVDQGDIGQEDNDTTERAASMCILPATRIPAMLLSVDEVFSEEIRPKAIEDNDDVEKYIENRRMECLYQQRWLQVEIKLKLARAVLQSFVNILLSDSPSLEDVNIEQKRERQAKWLDTVVLPCVAKYCAHLVPIHEEIYHNCAIDALIIAELERLRAQPISYFSELGWEDASQAQVEKDILAAVLQDLSLHVSAFLADMAKLQKRWWHSDEEA